MVEKLAERLASRRISVDEINARTAAIHHQVLRQSHNFDSPNFTRLASCDLLRMFREYDQRFFEGGISEALGETPLNFSMSKRMTRSAGSTTEFALPGRPDPHRFEIKFSVPLLGGCFAGKDHRPIRIAGRVCRDRLEALQRVMEHELVHLLEMLVWPETSSNCGCDRFQSIARRFFDHESRYHELISVREQAAVQYGIQPGSDVRFEMDGTTYYGFVNRITKRATVLVEDPRGEPYRNGKSYRKFYVPLSMLQKVEADERVT